MPSPTPTPIPGNAPSPATEREPRWLDLIRASGEPDLGKAITRMATLAAAAHRGEAAHRDSAISHPASSIGHAPTGGQR